MRSSTYTATYITWDSYEFQAWTFAKTSKFNYGAIAFAFSYSKDPKNILSFGHRRSLLEKRGRMKGKERTGVWVAQWMYDLDLNPNQIRLYAEIVSLDAKEGCYASNEYFAKILHLKADTISRLVSQLKGKGLLVQTHFDGRKRFLKPVVKEGQGSKGALALRSPDESAKRVGESLGRLSKADPLSREVSSYTLQKQNKLHLNSKPFCEEKWKEFQRWMEESMSPSTRLSLVQLKGPEELSGLQKRYWERWLATPRP
nr:helix-turn-helix domain-containing protein [Leptospira jelokensis]